MSKITPCLWVEDDLQEVFDYYQSIFPNAKLETINKMPDGNAITSIFEIEGQRFMALRGGPMFKFNEAVSFYVECKDQTESDYYWNKLTADRGEESQCGWLKDKYGLSWQIVPREFEEMMQGDDPVKVQRMIDAMMQMQRLDVAKLRAAYEGA
ncbi:MAG: VOC family protein [Dehalococcoidia bacterium]